VEHVSWAELAVWLKPYQDLSYPVLATLSDGEETIAATFKSCWPEAPHQRCQMHFLGNLAQEMLKEDDQLRQNLRNDLGGLPGVPKQPAEEDQDPLF
jgi:transposase-like protein